MPLPSGTRLGPYEILSAIGAGGMGEVYRARDTRLDRLVAIKLILAHVAADAEFRERFDREARAVSSLDHPHICTLYDVGHERPRPPRGDDRGSAAEAPIADFLVMQYLEGETLADRLSRAARPASDPTKPSSGDASQVGPVSTLSRGPVPLDTTLRYAAEIASALDAAHRRHIVHRDLKPGNVMVTKSGTKLLDFGLAKLAEQPPVGGFADMATRTSPLTGQGALLGTLHYMSPEQLEGRDVDTRSDIFSFGALLFEMLSGRRAFEGQSQASVIAAIVGADAPALGDLADSKVQLPLVAQRALERLLAKCLAKDPDDRWQSAADLSDELRWINEERLRAAVPVDAPVVPESAAAPTSRTRERLWMSIAALAVVAAVTVWLYPQPAPPPKSISFFVDAPDATSFALGPGLISISPDGQRLAFVTGQAPESKLWIRSLGSVIATEVPSADGAWHPVWSPDGRSIAFTSSPRGQKLKRIDVAGGPALTLAEWSLERPAWSSQGVILYTGEGNRLYRVPEAGGPSTPVTELDAARQETAHMWPVFLPDGRRFVYLADSSDAAKTALYLASLDSPGRTLLVNVMSHVDYVPGYLIYQRDGTLMAHPFDEKTGRLTGDAVPIVEDVGFNAQNGRGAFAVSPTGVLVVRTDSDVDLSGRLTWFDRSGNALGTVGEAADFSSGRIAPDGQRAVVTQISGGQDDLWMFDLARGVPARFTTDPSNDRYPVWSPNGETVVFASIRSGAYDLYAKAAGGATVERVLYASSENKVPTGFSPDGKVLLYQNGSGPNAAGEIWALPMTGDPKPVRVFPDSTAQDRQGVFSPDGRWIAYVSTDTGVGNVYVQAFPPNGARTRISTTNGSSPAWTADGRQILYVTEDDHYMAVDLTPAGGTISAGLPKDLFVRRQTSQSRQRSFMVDQKGERFLLSVAPEGTEPRPMPLTVVVNWASLLKR